VARQVVTDRPAVILVPGGDLITRFKHLTRTIPIVFYSFGANPVQMGLVDSYRQRGGTSPGRRTRDRDDEQERWQILGALRPGRTPFRHPLGRNPQQGVLCAPIEADHREGRLRERYRARARGRLGPLFVRGGSNRRSMPRESTS
jgi:hypothetical protein